MHFTPSLLLSVLPSSAFIFSWADAPFPKIDPTVDSSGHLSDVEDLTDPFDPQMLFGQTADLEIEIGSGKGLFVLNESGRVPERNFLGNEIAKKYCRFAAYKLAKNERANAHMMMGDGLKMFRDFLPDACAVAVHIYFPDPWWKERHRPRRVMRPQFISDLQRVLIPGGVFHFWTDVEEYFEETCGLMKEHSSLTGPHRGGRNACRARHGLPNSLRTSHAEARPRRVPLPIPQTSVRPT